MYQREAMWMSFNSASPKESYAVKISVGGVNALTGVPQDARSCGKQDYLPVGGEGGQLPVLSFFLSVVPHSRRDSSN